MLDYYCLLLALVVIVCNVGTEFEDFDYLLLKLMEIVWQNYNEHKATLSWKNSSIKAIYQLLLILFNCFLPNEFI